MPETRLLRAARIVVGGLLVLESLLLMLVGGFVAIVGGLTGALAFGVGGGSATSTQLAQTAAVMVLTLASPFVVAAVLGVGGVLLLIRRGKGLVVAAGLFAIAAQIGFHRFLAAPFLPAEVVLCAVHLLAIGVGFVFVPARAPAYV